MCCLDFTKASCVLYKRKGVSSCAVVDLLLLNCGLHDIKTDPSTGEQQVPLVQYQKNLQQIVALLQETSVELVWMRTTPCDESVHNHPDMKFHRFAADCPRVVPRLAR